MDAKFAGEGTSVSVEFAETSKSIPTEKISPAKPLQQKYNPRDGKLPAAYWTANKAVPIHWHQAVMAHLKVDHGHELTEDEFDDALDTVKNIKLT